MVLLITTFNSMISSEHLRINPRRERNIAKARLLYFNAHCSQRVVNDPTIGFYEIGTNLFTFGHNHFAIGLLRRRTRAGE
jgi:hypothetical protein